MPPTASRRPPRWTWHYDADGLWNDSDSTGAEAANLIAHVTGDAIRADSISFS